MNARFFVRVILTYWLLHSTSSRHRSETASPDPAVVCSSDFDRKGGMVLYVFVAVILAVGLGVLCEADYKHSLLVITERLKLSEDVAGATFMAAGSSSSEVFLNVIVLLLGSEDTGAGTIVGSAIFNVCVTIGLSCLFCPVDANFILPKPVMRDMTYNIIAFTWVIGSFADGKIVWYEAMIGFFLYVSYVVFMYYNTVILDWIEVRVNRLRGVQRVPERSISDAALRTDDEEGAASVEMEAVPRPQEGSAGAEGSTRSAEALDVLTGDESAGSNNDFSLEPASTTDNEDQPMTAPMMPGDNEFAVWKHVCGKPVYRLQAGIWYRPEGALDWIVAILGLPWRALFHFTIVNAENPTFPRVSVWMTFSMCLFYIGAFTFGLSFACQKIGCLLGMDEAVTGATLLAWCTSLPDALTSIFVAKAGKADMSVSGVLGSNVFDVLFALGVPWLIVTIVKQAPVVVDPAGAVIYSGILFGLLFVFFSGLVWRKWRLDRVLAVILLALYGGFLVFIILHTVKLIVF